MNLITALVKSAMYAAFRPNVIYKEKNIKKYLKNKPCIFVSNHISHKDGLFALSVLSEFKPYVLVAKDWYDKKLMGFFLKHAHTVPIDRFNPDADWYIMAQETVKCGGSMLIFPEGSTSKDGNMKEFKPGAALLAAKTQVPVIPCAIKGKYKKFFGERQRMIIGEPIEMSCPDNMRLSQYAKKQTALIQDKVKELILEEN